MLNAAVTELTNTSKHINEKVVRQSVNLWVLYNLVISIFLIIWIVYNLKTNGRKQSLRIRRLPLQTLVPQQKSHWGSSSPSIHLLHCPGHPLWAQKRHSGIQSTLIPYSSPVTWEKWSMRSPTVSFSSFSSLWETTQSQPKLSPQSLSTSIWSLLWFKLSLTFSKVARSSSLFKSCSSWYASFCSSCWWLTPGAGTSSTDELTSCLDNSIYL